jgi:diacylglycerol kinase family enzyme
LDPAQPVEVDGDVLDPATRLRFSIDPDALIVRVLSTGPE